MPIDFAFPGAEVSHGWTARRPGPNDRRRFGGGTGALSFWGYSPPEVDGIWLWVYCYKIPMHPVFDLLKGDYRGLRV